MLPKTILTTGAAPNYALHPLKYEFAWSSYKTMMRNHWTPEQIGVGDDLADWRSDRLSLAERHLYETVFAQLTTFDLMRTADLVQNLLPLIAAPELVHALTTQAFQECLHTHAYQYLIESLGLPENDIYQRYRRVPALMARVDCAEAQGELPSPSYLIGLHEQRHTHDRELRDTHAEILRALIFYFCLFEGVWFLVNLAGPVQSLARRQRMVKTAEQFQYIARDEQVHVAFGLQLIRAVIDEYPHAWTDADRAATARMAERACQLEDDFIDHALPEPILGYHASDHKATARHYAERWLARIGLDCDLGGEQRLPWIDEMLALKKEKNFFETHVTEYQTGAGLRFDESPAAPRDATNPFADWDNPVDPRDPAHP